MSRKLTDIPVYLDWVDRHGQVKCQYSQRVATPFLIGSSSRLLVPPEKLLEAEEISSPLFNEQGFCSIAEEVPQKGM